MGDVNVRDYCLKVEQLEDAEMKPSGKIYREMVEQSRKLPYIPRSVAYSDDEKKSLVAMFDLAWTVFSSQLSVYANRLVDLGYWNYILTGEGVGAEYLQKFRRKRISDEHFAWATLDAMTMLHQNYRRVWLDGVGMTALTEEAQLKRLLLAVPFPLLGWEKAEIFLDIFGPILVDLTGDKRQSLVSRTYTTKQLEYLRLHQIEMKGDLLRHLMGLDVWGKVNPTLRQMRSVVDTLWPGMKIA